MKLKLLPYLIWFFAYFLLPVFSQGQLPTPHPSPLSISVKQIDNTDDQKNQVIFQLELMEGYKAYLNKFQIKSRYPQEVNFSSLEVEPIIVFYDKFFGKTQKGFVGQGQLSAQFNILQETDIHKLDGYLIYQACTDDFCLLPKEIPFSLDISNHTQKPDALSRFHQALNKGIFWAFFFVFIAGFLTSLTPCIFPMIPITLSILGTQVIGQSRSKSFALSLCYVLGIGITYALLGVMAAKTGSFFGAMLANPIVISVIAIVFVLMGLGMYGIFEVQTPLWIQNQLSGKNVTKGFKGVFLAGLISGVVASPCVGPVLIGILTYVSQTQDTILGFLLLFTFAMGLGILFLLLGTFSQLINKLPKSGPWMDSVKFLFGTSMIAMALYYLNFVVHFHYLNALLGILFILLGIYFYWKFKPLTSFHFNSKFVHILIKILNKRKSVSSICYMIGIVFLSIAFFDQQINRIYQKTFFVEDTQVVVEEQNETATIWKEFTDDLFKNGIIQNQPIIIDFTAEWCAVCKALETNTFSNIDVQVEFKNFLLLQIDATTETENVARWISEFKVLGLPTLLFYNIDGTLQKDLTLTNFEGPKAFLQRMKKALK